jgi:RNA ligase
MNYEFPIIRGIDDVLPAIEGRNEFIVAEKDGYNVVNYVVMKEDTFPTVVDKNTAILREARGMIFAPNGELISRPFHKFFNVNERKETLLQNIEFGSHKIMTKLDGSMVRPFYVGKYIRWGTKMGITDVAMNAEKFVAQNPYYNDFVRPLLDDGFTPIFEWMSPEDRIVIDYGTEPSLVLLALRDNTTGLYYGVQGIPGIPTVGFHNIDHTAIVDHTRSLQDAEGFVVQFNDGHMLKIKSDWYVTLHKSASLVKNERAVVSLILKDDVDDLKGFLTENDLKLVRELENTWVDRIFEEQEVVENILFNVLNETGSNRKDFALALQKNVSKKYHGILFQSFENQSVETDTIKNYFLSKMGSKKSFDELNEEFK